MPSQGGFWKRLWGKVRNALEASPWGAVLLEIMDGISGHNKLTEEDTVNLNASDYATVNAWDLNYFNPFFVQLSKDCKDVFEKGGTLQVQVQKANAILSKIDAITQVYIKNADKYSKEAFTVRLNYVSRSFAVLTQFMDDQFSTNKSISKKSVVVNISSVNIKPLISSNAGVTSFNSYQYAILAGTDSSTPVTAPTVYVDVPDATDDGSNDSGSNYILPAVGVGLLVLAVASSGKKSKK